MSSFGALVWQAKKCGQNHKSEQVTKPVCESGLSHLAWSWCAGGRPGESRAVCEGGGASGVGEWVQEGMKRDGLEDEGSSLCGRQEAGGEGQSGGGSKQVCDCKGQNL